VNQNQLYNLQLGLNGFGRILTLVGFALLLSAVGLGWLVKSFLFVLGLLIIVPIVGIFVFQWWVRKNIVQAACPVCGTELTGFNQAQMQCSNCGEPLQAEQGKFKRMTPSGTIDVEAVEVAAQVVDD
jgi:energy-coupling factor transporter transmembrane protein EcfT